MPSRLAAAVDAHHRGGHLQQPFHVVGFGRRAQREDGLMLNHDERIDHGALFSGALATSREQGEGGGALSKERSLPIPNRKVLFPYPILHEIKHLNAGACVCCVC
jgi:hypothetical protein